LANALKKLGRYSSGSRVENPHALGLAHLFFGSSVGFTFAGLFDTHPSLADRIRAIEPTWDGKFDYAGTSQILKTYDGSHPSLIAEQGKPLQVLNFTYNAGRGDAQALKFAAGLLSSLPEPLVQSAREPFGARAVVLAILAAGSDGSLQERQMELARQAVEP